MHQAAYAELGIDAIYQALPIPPELFAETVRALPGSGFRGINVTIPHKHAAAEIADARSPAVEAIGAANTLTFSDGEIHADNTDAPGMIAALGGDVSGRSALVLGAGGTARAAVWALRDGGAAVKIQNRTPERAAKLADDLGGEVVFEIGGGAEFDLIVNTTAVGMDADVDEDDALAALGLDLAAIDQAATIVDFVYRSGGAPLTSAACAHGLKVIDGAELLARQGALSFERWFGTAPPLDVMRAAIAT